MSLCCGCFGKKKKKIANANSRPINNNSNNGNERNNEIAEEEESAHHSSEEEIIYNEDDKGKEMTTLVIKTNIPVQDIKVAETKPFGKERRLYKYLCPLCFRYFSNILQCVECKNYVCALCAQDLIDMDLKNSKFTMRCPHCCSETFMLSDVDLKAEVRKYTDSAYLTFKMTMNKGAPTLNPTLNYPITKDGCCIQSPRQLISGNQVIEIDPLIPSHVNPFLAMRMTALNRKGGGRGRSNFIVGENEGSPRAVGNIENNSNYPNYFYPPRPRYGQSLVPVHPPIYNNKLRRTMGEMNIDKIRMNSMDIQRGEFNINQQFGIGDGHQMVLGHNYVVCDNRKINTLRRTSSWQEGQYSIHVISPTTHHKDDLRVRSEINFYKAPQEEEEYSHQELNPSAYHSSFIGFYKSGRGGKNNPFAIPGSPLFLSKFSMEDSSFERDSESEGIEQKNISWLMRSPPRWNPSQYHGSPNLRKTNQINIAMKRSESEAWRSMHQVRDRNTLPLKERMYRKIMFGTCHDQNNMYTHTKNARASYNRNAFRDIEMPIPNDIDDNSY